MVVDLAQATAVRTAAPVRSRAEEAAIGVDLGGTREVHRAFHPAVLTPAATGTQRRGATTAGGAAFRAAMATLPVERTGSALGMVLEAAITMEGVVPTTGVADTATAGAFTSATIPVITATTIPTTAIPTQIRTVALLTIPTATA